MNRADAAAFIGGRYAAYLTAVNRTAADTSGNLKEAIDDALRAIGFGASDTATASTEADSQLEKDFRLQVSYRTMEQVVRDLRATSFRFSTSGDSFDLGKLPDSAEKELSSLEALVLARFGTLDADVSGSVDFENPFVTIDLQILTDAYEVA